MNTGPAGPNWAQRRDVALAIIGWFIILAVALWAASYVANVLLIITVASLLAYALFPGVQFLARLMPRGLAILIVYLAALIVIGSVGYYIVGTAIAQLTSLGTHLGSIIQTQSKAQSPLLQLLSRFGISGSQLQTLSTTALGAAQSVVGQVIPFLQAIFGVALDTILVIVLSIYLVIDGPRIILWLQTGVPIRYRPRVHFMIHTVERVVGGYIRGQFTLAALVGVLVGAGMAVLGLPYATLLGMLAFVLEFIPIIGVFVSGLACVFVALTKGFVLALIVLAYFVIVHIIEGDVVGPRIVGHAVGVHPIISIMALLAGAELFGLWGALFAAPVAGVIQAFLAEFWSEWRALNPTQFPDSTAAMGLDMPGPVPDVERGNGALAMEDDEGKTQALPS